MKAAPSVTIYIKFNTQIGSRWYILGTISDKLYLIFTNIPTEYSLKETSITNIKASYKNQNDLYK